MHRHVPTEMHRAKSATGAPAPRIAPCREVCRVRPPTSPRRSGAGGRAGMVAGVMTSDNGNVTEPLLVLCTRSVDRRRAGVTASA